MSSLRLQRLLGSAMRAASEALTLEDLARNAIPLIARAMDAPIYLLHQAVREGTTRAFAAEPQEMYQHFMRGEFWRESPHSSAERQHRFVDRIMIGSALVPQSDFRKTRFYNEFMRAHEAEYLMAARFREGPEYQQGMIRLTLGRAKGQKDFSQDDVRLLARAMPPLEAAARRATRLAALLDRGEVIEHLAARRPLVALDGAGKILWLAGEAEKMLASALGVRRSLPPALSSAARQLFALARDVVFEALPGTSVPVQLEDGRALRAELSIARRASGEPFVVVELDGPGARSDALAALVERTGLTPAEARVLAGVAAGLHNADIARQLGLSPGTVRIHLSNVFRKLGVSSRVQAILLVRR